jgi:hypothetical protein
MLAIGAVDKKHKGSAQREVGVEVWSTRDNTSAPAATLRPEMTPPPTDVQAEGDAVRIHVVGPDGRPVAGASIDVDVTAPGRRKSIRGKYVSNTYGEITLAPQKGGYVNLVVRKDGYLTIKSCRQVAKLPDDLTIKLKKLTAEQAKAMAALEGNISVWPSDNGQLMVDFYAGGDSALESLRHLPDPDVLIIQSENVTDAGLAHLDGLRSLNALTLMCDKITDAGLAHLVGLQGLKHLELQSLKITDAGLPHLQSLHSLEGLTLATGGVTEAGLKHLAPLKELRSLIVYRLPIDPATVKVVGTLGGPTILDFRELPLQDVCEYLSDFHNIKVQIGAAAAKSGKVTDVTCLLKDVPLSAALDKMLSPMGLGWVVERGAVVITTSDVVAKRNQEIDKLRRALPKLERVIVALPEPSPPATTTPPTGGTNGKAGTSDPPPAAKPLDEAVARFNQALFSCRFDVEKSRQPALTKDQTPAPLTVEEVVAAIRKWDQELFSPRHPAPWRQFRSPVAGRVLTDDHFPPEWAWARTAACWRGHYAAVRRPEGETP